MVCLARMFLIPEVWRKLFVGPWHSISAEQPRALWHRGSGPRQLSLGHLSVLLGSFKHLKFGLGLNETKKRAIEILHKMKLLS